MSSLPVPTLDQGSPERKRTRMAHDLADYPDPLANKREKARERQRKKRERDRTVPQSLPPNSIPFHDPNGFPDPVPQSLPHQHMLSADELARKEKVRLAARDRQRKHRAVVKARRMAELGLVIPTNPADPLGFRVNENGEMEPVHDANAANAHGSQDYPTTPGQTFARLLMSSAAFNHNLKHHLLRTMQMTNEELDSFEPIIAAAWDHWNHQRMHYITSQGQVPTPNSAFGGRTDGDNGEGTGGENNVNYSSEQANEYRSRFHKPLTEPSPFQQMPGGPSAHSNPIDPSLAAQAVRETSAMRNQAAEGAESANDEDGRQENAME